MSSINARGDISRTGINIYSLALLRVLLECGYYSRQGLIWGNTVPNSKNYHEFSYSLGLWLCLENLGVGTVFDSESVLYLLGDSSLLLEKCPSLEEKKCYKMYYCHVRRVFTKDHVPWVMVLTLKMLWTKGRTYHY